MMMLLLLALSMFISSTYPATVSSFNTSTNTEENDENPEKHREQDEQTPGYWTNMARASIDEALRLQTLNTNVAKNVVLFLGDGMGVETKKGEHETLIVQCV
ncbi:uncharacterized protein LOC144876421 [Branchiostoma floridae x Branchiostoma japonicum]